jgi:S-disulfanyl-L-cysteine oxidoreductase SoxD
LPKCIARKLISLSSICIVASLMSFTANAEPVSYSVLQAEKGEKKYQAYCEECHGEDLKGGTLGGALLRGNNFLGNFGGGSPASSLFQYISEMMPPESPGRFSPTAYAELMAYILKRNGFPEGSPLPTDLDALDNLTVGE